MNWVALFVWICICFMSALMILLAYELLLYLLNAIDFVFISVFIDWVQQLH